MEKNIRRFEVVDGPVSIGHGVMVLTAAQFSGRAHAVTVQEENKTTGERLVAVNAPLQFKVGEKIQWDGAGKGDHARLRALDEDAPLAKQRAITPEVYDDAAAKIVAGAYKGFAPDYAVNGIASHYGLDPEAVRAELDRRVAVLQEAAAAEAKAKEEAEASAKAKAEAEAKAGAKKGAK